jgi:multidrug transporter EmrE-like cation transporter
LVYVIIFTASYFIFDEVFTSVKILGIILILSGLVLLNARS